ncbi:hypothetical protein P3T23_000980 [Paraburkholderia sp. GAS448]|uniref:hypothetical protein n=1 Tax=Paraburkholderia sp. GAS448 TaxID=3035136 RepID=UPI003D2555A1
MQLEHAMATLAERDGDVGALTCISSKDLSGTCRFLLVAELCVKHGRPEHGLAWAERGITESGQSIGQRLLDFCIDAYLRCSEFDKADAYAWRRFEMRPTLDELFRWHPIDAAEVARDRGLCKRVAGSKRRNPTCLTTCYKNSPSKRET